MTNIAFLGAGLMGTGMATNLIKAGHQVRVYNRTTTKAEPLAALGATIASSPADAALDADAIFSMVGDDTASKAMWYGPEGALAGASRPGALAIECSTISHDLVLELSGKARDAGFDYLDCPVTGFPPAAASGQLTLFLGGEQSVIKKAQDLLNVISSNQLYFGAIGQGTAYKLIVNLMGSIQIAATAEGLLTAERAGLDLDLVAEALASGGCGSPQVARNSALMVQGRHEEDIWFTGHWRLKDTDYGLKFSQKMGLALPLAEETQKSFAAVVEDGFGDSAESILIDVMRNRQG